MDAIPRDVTLETKLGRAMVESGLYLTWLDNRTKLELTQVYFALQGGNVVAIVVSYCPLACRSADEG